MFILFLQIKLINKYQASIFHECGYHVPEPTCLGKMSKPLQPSRHRFWKDRLRNTGDLACLEHATEPSPPRSADGSSAADTPPSGFSAAGLWKAPLDSFYPRAGEALTTARPPLSLVTFHFLALVLRASLGVSSCPVSPSVNGLVYQPVLLHTPPP